MPRHCPFSQRYHALSLVCALLLMAVAPGARAVPLALSLDAGQSQLQQGGGAAALSGSLLLELGELPPVASNTALAVTGLSVSGGGLVITLDEGLANPGLGVLFPDGSFLIPSLHLVVSGDDLTVTNVSGSLAPDPACGGALCLLAGFDLDPGAGGIITVAVVAAVPEPARIGLVSVLVLTFGVLRRRGV